jgi:cell division septum initiation protein DivIVA
LDTDERTRFHFDDYEKAREMTKKFYDDKTVRNFLDALQKVKSLANSTKDQSESIPK